MIRLDFRSTDFTFGFTCFPVLDVIKKLFVSQVNTLCDLLDNLTRQLIPMRFRPLFQLRDMTADARKRRIFSIDSIIASLQPKQVDMHAMQVVNQISNLNDIRLVI